MLFYDDLSILLQNFLTDGQTDTSPTIKFYQRVRDVSAHMVQYFLETEIYPQAKVCLAFIKVELALRKFQLWSSSTIETKWTLLQQFQNELRDALFPNNKLNSPKRNHISQILKHQENGCDPEKL